MLGLFLDCNREVINLKNISLNMELSSFYISYEKNNTLSKYYWEIGNRNHSISLEIIDGGIKEVFFGSAKNLIDRKYQDCFLSIPSNLKENELYPFKIDVVNNNIISDNRSNIIYSESNLKIFLYKNALNIDFYDSKYSYSTIFNNILILNHSEDGTLLGLTFIHPKMKEFFSQNLGEFDIY